MSETPTRNANADEAARSGVRADAIDSLWFAVATWRRARRQPFTFVAAADGRVNVRNDSHDDPGAHIYTVFVLDGVPARCTCPDDRYRPETGACKHRVGLALAAADR